MSISTPYLIQRMRFRKEPRGQTFDGILELDYMGSAEFEFGSLPASLKELCKGVDGLVIAAFPATKNMKGEALHLIALTAEDAEAYGQHLPKLVAEDTLRTNRTTPTIRLKEPLLMFFSMGKDWDGKPLKKDDDYRCFHAWWDIVNHVIFTFGRANAERIIAAIKEVRNKKKADSVEGWY